MPETPAEITEQLLSVFSITDARQRASIFEAYPNAALPNALLFLEATEPIYNLAALDCMATSFVYGGELPTGEAFADACIQRAVSLQQAGIDLPEKDLFFYLGNSTYLLQKLLLDSGRYAHAVHVYQNQQQMGLPGWHTAAFAATHLQAAENYFENNQTDMARELQATISRETVPPASLVLYDRLLFKFKNITAAVHQSPEDMARFKRAQQASDTRAMLAATREVMKGHEHEIDLASMEQLLEVIEKGEAGADLMLTELARKISKTSLETKSSLSGVHTTDTVQHKRYELNDAIYFLNDDEQNSKKENLETCIVQLKILMDWFIARNLYSDIAFTSWNMYTCYDFLEDHYNAAEALEIIYAYLEKQRLSITDIQKRAGVFKQYPQLFANMAFSNHQIGNATRLFHRIEASKARNLADRMLLLLKDGGESAQPSPDSLKEELAPLLAANQAHYLSFFVDEHRTYCVLLNGKGNLIGWPNAPGEATLRNWQQKDYASPQTWRAPRSGLFGKKSIPDIPGALNDYIKVIELAMDEGMIKEGDHIVYSPDGMLNLFPLQLARLKSGEYLIEKFSVSKIHGGRQLLHLLRQQRVRPQQIYSVTCPAMQDNQEKQSAFYQLENWLNAEVNARALPGSVNGWLDNATANSHYHMATHGVFPQPMADEDLQRQNPYYNSGLLLGNGALLPELMADGRYYQGAYLLSPKLLYESGVDLSGCHISMQACVSGRSKEGYGGDALGMEWALFFAGAQSMISAGWNIDVHWSNKIFERIYKGWYQEQKSLAQAYSDALLTTLKEAPVNDTLLPPEYFWAGLILSGDFR